MKLRFIITKHRRLATIDAAAMFFTVLALASLPSVAQARQTSPYKGKPIRIGFLAPVTGFLAQPGKDMENGFKLFLKQHHDEIDGRPLRVYFEDSEAKPAVALSKLRELVTQDHIQLLFSPVSAAVGTALESYINAHRLPTIDSIIASDNLTQRTLSPYIVRTSWTASQVTMPFGYYAYHKLGYRRIATIGFGFRFGYQLVAGFQQTFQAAGGKIVEKLWPPIGQQDYSPYISKLESAKPQAVFAAFAGGDAVRFLKQWRSFGAKIPLLADGTMTDWSSLPGEGKNAVGIITALHYSADRNTPENEKFVKAYDRKYGHPPSYYAEGPYTAGLFLVKAIKAVGGDIENKSAFLNALRETRVNAPRGPVRLGPWQNPIENVYIMKVVMKNGRPANKVIYTYHNVSQFWKYNPAWFLSRPVFSIHFPKCNACS